MEREKIIHTLLGKCVHVEVDRPMGYCHGDIVYPVNYGYIPGLVAGDGEEQDAYILGITEPVASFDGQVIGAIRRKNDVEDKLVVAPEGLVLHQGEIAQAVHFQEQYFDSTVECLFHKSCGVIAFRQTAEQREYLILLQNSHSWSFPKGHMEPGETETQTALRELWEETGLRAELIPGARVALTYPLTAISRKEVVLFLGRAKGEMSLQQQEIADYRWVGSEQLSDYLHPDTLACCMELLRER